jgi:hypothetical protein
LSSQNQKFQQTCEELQTGEGAVDRTVGGEKAAEDREDKERESGHKGDNPWNENLLVSHSGRLLLMLRGRKQFWRSQSRRGLLRRREQSIFL